MLKRKTWHLVCLAVALLAGCIGLDPSGKDKCEVQAHCLDRYVCINRVCIHEDEIPDADPTPDTAPPDADIDAQ